MLCLGWRRTPVVVTAIRKSNGRFNEFHWIGVIEGGQLDRNVVTANLFVVSACKGAHATVLAKKMMSNLWIELVIAQIALAG